MDWISCKKSKMAKEAKVDKNLINSIIAESSKKFVTAQSINLNETSASSKLSLTYDSLRELLEALAVQTGFKIYNHECYCAFLKEVLKEHNLGEEFDAVRKIRNSINYYGKHISAEEAGILIKGIIKLIENVKTLLKK